MLYQQSWLCFLLISNLYFIICEFSLCIIFKKFNWYFAELSLTIEFSLLISAKHIGHFNADLYVLVLSASRHLNSSWAKLKSIVLRNSWLLNRVKTSLNKKCNFDWMNHEQDIYILIISPFVSFSNLISMLAVSYLNYI